MTEEQEDRQEDKRFLQYTSLCSQVFQKWGIEGVQAALQSIGGEWNFSVLYDEEKGTFGKQKCFGNMCGAYDERSVYEWKRTVEAADLRPKKKEEALKEIERCKEETERLQEFMQKEGVDGVERFLSTRGRHIVDDYDVCLTIHPHSLSIHVEWDLAPKRKSAIISVSTSAKNKRYLEETIGRLREACLLKDREYLTSEFMTRASLLLAGWMDMLGMSMDDLFNAALAEGARIKNKQIAFSDQEVQDILDAGGGKKSLKKYIELRDIKNAAFQNNTPPPQPPHVSQ